MQYIAYRLFPKSCRRSIVKEGKCIVIIYVSMFIHLLNLNGSVYLDVTHSLLNYDCFPGITS